MSTRIKVEYKELKEGLKVYWTDPSINNYNDEHSSGYFKVSGWMEDISPEDDADYSLVYIKNEAGSEAEVYLCELSQDSNAVDFITGNKNER